MRKDNEFVELTEEQIIAISIARKLARKLVNEHPEISKIYVTPEDFRRDLFQPNFDINEHEEFMNGRRIKDIADRFILEYQKSEAVKETAVQCALAELIEREERERELRYRKTLNGYLIKPEVRSKAGQIGGKRVHEIHPDLRDRTLTREVIATRNRAYWNSLSEEEREERLKNLTFKGGKIPWKREEVTYLLTLLDTKAYQHQNGNHKGRPNLELVTEELNRAFGNNRSKKATHTRMAKLQGYNPKNCPRFGLEEAALIVNLCEDPEFQHLKGGWYKGRPDMRRIVDYVNSIYGNSRSRESISSFYARYKTSKS